jgi:hypothetical protein
MIGKPLKNYSSRNTIPLNALNPDTSERISSEGRKTKGRMAPPRNGTGRYGTYECGRSNGVWRQVAGEGGAACPAPSPQPARSLSLRVVVLILIVVVYDVIYLLEHLLSRFYRILKNKIR